MREILFRAKRVDNGEWVYGFYFKQCCDDIIHCIGAKPLCANDYSEILGEWYEIIPETIGQYTGLTDKNGTKIFEGDIVRVHDKFIDIVKYELGCFIMSKQMINYEFTYQDFNNIEVIGNIHDNPELLEVEELTNNY